MFGDLAPKYWAKGISVIPLFKESKRPVPTSWTDYATRLPTDIEQKTWLAGNFYNNIGLVLGQQSNVMVVDIDIDDPKIIKDILSVIPNSPWERIGKKGKVLAFKYNGRGTEKVIGVVDGQERTIVEILSQGAQVVLPPSIHPDTKKPYVSNCDLLDVIDALPVLPVDTVEKIRAKIGQYVQLKSLKSEKRFSSVEFVSSGARDNQMNRCAGMLARDVIQGKLTVKQALSDMLAWYEMRVQHLNGDEIDVTKGQSQVIQYIHSDLAKGRILPPNWDEGMTKEEKDLWGFNLEVDQEEWTYDQHIVYIKNLTDTYAKDSLERHTGMEFVLKKLSKSTQLSKLDLDRILISLKSDTKVTVSSLRGQIKEYQAGEIEGKSHTEIAKAVITEMTKRLGELAYHNNRIWCWNGAFWDSIDDQVVRTHIQNEFGSYDLSKRGADHKQILSVIKDQLPQNIVKDGVEILGVNFANGFLNKDLVIMPHSSEYGMTYALPFSYKPELAGKCPKFFKYLEDSWGGHSDYLEKKVALQEVICATLYGMMTSFAKAVLLHGPGGSGKSVLMNIVSELVPSEAKCAVSPENWSDKYVPAMFVGKILNVAGELSEKRKIDGKAFKEIVSGELITCEEKFQQPFMFKPRVANWFCSNSLPKSDDTSNGFNRRWLIFKFTTVVSDNNKILDLHKEIINEEIEGIVAWALAVFPSLLIRESFTIPQSHKELVSEMALQNSDVRQWIDARLTKGETEAELDFITLYKDYSAYTMHVLCKRALDPKGLQLQLEQILLELGMSDGHVTNRGRVYTGIRIKKLGEI